VTACHKSSLTSQVKLDVKYHMARYPLITYWYCESGQA
jgi:hypothetical protein